MLLPLLVQKDNQHAWDTQYDAPFEIKEVSEDGTFTGYASTFNNMDSDRDIILPGAFAKTLKNKSLRKIKMLWQHDPRKPIGVWKEMREDEKGLFVKGQFILEVEQAREAYALMKAKALDSMSIGFAIPKGGWEWDEKKRVRKIAEVDLWETSVVTFPANRRATVARVKAASLPVADNGYVWDEKAAEERVDGRATAYVGGHLVADVVDGTVTLIPKAVFAAAGHVLLEGPEGFAPEQLNDCFETIGVPSPFGVDEDAVKSFIKSRLSVCSTARDFERTLRDVGFSKTEARAFASVHVPQRDVEDELATKLDAAAGILNNINLT